MRHMLAVLFIPNGPAIFGISTLIVILGAVILIAVVALIIGLVVLRNGSKSKQPAGSGAPMPDWQRQGQTTDIAWGQPQQQQQPGGWGVQGVPQQQQADPWGGKTHHSHRRVPGVASLGMWRHHPRQETPGGIHNLSRHSLSSRANQHGAHRVQHLLHHSQRNKVALELCALKKAKIQGVSTKYAKIH